MSQAGIYAWKLNERYVYVGKSVDVNSRMYRNHSDNIILSLAIRKYGYDNFDKEVISYCESYELNDLEIYYIRELHTHRSEGGYNATWGGDGQSAGEGHPFYGVTGKDHPSYGQKRSEETIKKLSDSHMGITHSDETKRKIADSKSGTRNPFFGSKYEDSTSQYYGVSKVGNKYRALITVNKKLTHIGYFDSEIDAATAYNEYVIENGLPNPLNNL